MKIKISDIVSATKGHLIQGDPETFIDCFSTNSKEIPELSGKSVLFVPVMGERVDGHRFIENACEAGAVAFFINDDHKMPSVAKNICAIEVADAVKALQDTAAWYRDNFNIPVLGITGSVGKTSTKEMVAAALSSIKVHSTKGNQNSQIGLPITVFGIDKDDKAAIVEMGMSMPGEMARIAAVSKPDYAVFTNVGVAHIGNLHSKENIRAEKLHITDHFNEESILFVNDDDPLLHELADPSCPARPALVRHVVTFGTTPHADYYASSISVSGDGTDFVVNYPLGENGSLGSIHVHLAVLGLHNVRNALAAFAVASSLGISTEDAKKGIESYRPLAMRGNIIKVNGITLVDDTYNASPDSMKSAIDVLGSMRGGTEPIRRRIAVLADVLELGEDSEKEHFSVGTFIRDYNAKDPDHRINILVTVGNDSKQIAYGATADIGAFNPEVKSFDSNTDAIDYLKSEIKNGDAIVVKGSRGMHTDEIVHALADGRAVD